jgi:DNA-binding MarR family transcriptional regulator
MHDDDANTSDRLAHLIKLVSRGFARVLQLRLADNSVPIGQWLFLRILWEFDGITQRELSHRANLGEPTVFAALKAMEKAGYITRLRSKKDRRKVSIFLTEEGRALEAVLSPYALEVNQLAVARIQLDHLEIIRNGLRTMLENLDADEKRMRDQGRLPAGGEARAES